MALRKLQPGTILLVEVGSTAHGTGDPSTEDHDETAIVIESSEQVIIKGAEFKNMMWRTQPEGVQSGPGDIDRHLYSLRNFLDLALHGNPSIMMCLWAPLIQYTDAGIALQQLGPSFIGRHIIPKYRGYMKSQAGRLLGTRGGGHGKRGNGGRPEIIEKYGWDTKYAMHTARLGYQCMELLETRKLTFPIQGHVGRWLRSLRRGEVPFTTWWAEVLELDNQLDKLQYDTSVPEGPNYDKIHDFSIAVHTQYWDNPTQSNFWLEPYQPEV